MKIVKLKITRKRGPEDTNPFWDIYEFNAELGPDGTIVLGATCQWTESCPWYYSPRTCYNQTWRVQNILKRAEEGYEDEVIAKQAIVQALRNGESEWLKCILEDEPEWDEYHNGYDIYVTAHATATTSKW